MVERTGNVRKIEARFRYEQWELTMKDYASRAYGMLGDGQKAKKVADCVKQINREEYKVRGENGEVTTHYKKTHYHCGMKICPVCHNRAMREFQWSAYRTCVKTIDQYPDHVYAFITLTSNLGRKQYSLEDSSRFKRDIRSFQDAFADLLRSCWFKKNVSGVIWRLVIKPAKRGKKVNGSANKMRFNIHIHAILAIPCMSIKNKLVTKSVLSEKWKDALRAKYRPQVDLYYDIRGYSAKSFRKKEKGEGRKVSLWNPNCEERTGSWKSPVYHLVEYMALRQREFELRDYAQEHENYLLIALGLLAKSVENVNRYRMSGIFARNRVKPAKQKTAMPPGEIVEERQTLFVLNPDMKTGYWEYYVFDRPPS